MKVVMFHSVGNDKGQWRQKWLSVSLNHFDSFCQFLQKKHYKTIFLDKWYYLQNNQHEIENKHIVLTFDDGYLDNWVFVYPILKKYNLKATIFVNPEFVDIRDIVRPTLESVWKNELKFDDLDTLGYLSWKEIVSLDKSGIIEIQSHSMSHNFYFKSNKIIDFYAGEEKYRWINWFLRPDDKGFNLDDDYKIVIPFGYPIFEYGRALELKRFIPSNELITSLNQKYQHLRNNNYSVSQIKQFLHEEYKQFQDSNMNIGLFESDKEMEKRYRYEIFESKRILEEKLNKDVNFLCWPGGGYNDLSISLSKEANYKASTLASGENVLFVDNSAKYKRIDRFGLGSFIQTKNKLFPVKNRKYLIFMFKAKRNKLFFRIILKLHKEIIKILLRF